MTKLREIVHEFVRTQDQGFVRPVPTELHRVLVAAGLGPRIGRERDGVLERIVEADGQLYFRMVLRGHEPMIEFSLPASIIDADDPIEKAEIWNLRGQIEGERLALETARQHVVWHETRLVELEAQLLGR